MIWQADLKLQRQVKQLSQKLAFIHLKVSQIFVFRSFGSKSQATARIWGLPTIWQQALKVKPAYCLEVISEKFDRLSGENQQKVLIHELLHIPKKFSGALLPHKHRSGKINQQKVDQLYKKSKQ